MRLSTKPRRLPNGDRYRVQVTVTCPPKLLPSEFETARPFHQTAFAGSAPVERGDEGDARRRPQLRHPVRLDLHAVGRARGGVDGSALLAGRRAVLA